MSPIQDGEGVSSGPSQDEPPRIDPWTVSITNVLDGDAGEQETE
jgi:hypothetical protein